MNNPELNRRIGNRIRERRKALRMTQSELTGKEFTKSFVSQVEKGQTAPSIAALVIIARRLGRSLDYFVSEAPESAFEIGRQLAALGINPEEAADLLERLSRILK